MEAGKTEMAAKSPRLLRQPALGSHPNDRLDFTDYTATDEFRETNFKSADTLKTGERRLLYKALVLGIVEILNPKGRYVRPLDDVKNLEWLNSESREHALCFEMLCEEFSLPTRRLRARIIEMREMGEKVRSSQAQINFAGSGKARVYGLKSVMSLLTDGNNSEEGEEE